jgi:multidrug efflux pump subunit AcrB
MDFLRRLLNNHVLANLTFVLVLGVGLWSYLNMPRAKDPQVTLHWVNIITALPGAAAEDIERRITDPFEEAIRRSVSDIDFISSTSREGISNILVRLEDIPERVYDKRLADLRREIQNTYTDEVPDEADDPVIYEVTSSNWFPVATIVVTSKGDDENLRRQARNVKKDIEQIEGVDRIDDIGPMQPELQVQFYPERLIGLSITAADLADTVRGYFQDVAAGDIDTQDGQWLVRIEGTDADPGVLANLPVVTGSGIVELGQLADLVRTSEEPTELVRFGGQPAALMALTKTKDANVLEIIERVNEYIERRNTVSDLTGVELVLIDDQTISTRKAISLMQNNALIGLSMVLVVTWLFLGTRISLLTSIGIPFTLAGTFIVLKLLDMTVNQSVLLGIVIALGMLVDDAVVVVETMYRRLQQGVAGLNAAMAALREVFAPVTTSVMTTIAAFLPLALLPGVLGEFMKVIPITVSVALAVSLAEAYWMLPAHVIAARVDFSRPGKSQRKREWITHMVRLRYTQLLLKALRHPIISAAAVLLALAVAVATLVGGFIPVDFFRADSQRIFYVNTELAPGTSLEETNRELQELESLTLSAIHASELRATVTYGGQMFTETEPLFGDTVGQIMVSLQPRLPGGRDSSEISNAVEDKLDAYRGPARVTLLRMTDGPPTLRPVSVKIRGDTYESILAAERHLREFIAARDFYNNIASDYRPGNPSLSLRHDGNAIKRAGFSPETVNRIVRLYVDGELVTDFQDQGEEVRVRILPHPEAMDEVSRLLAQPISLPSGRSIPLGELVESTPGHSLWSIRHYNYRRAVTLEADIDKTRIDTVKANKLIAEEWERVRTQFPEIDLDFSGELDDIDEALSWIYRLFGLGVALIYVIIGTQFRSYWQPFMILITVPLAFTGVLLGLLVTRNILSLYTMYGVVALAGIAVNSAIVLISAANDRLDADMSLIHATVYAARRRVIPILITSLTTIAGLFSLAAGLAGKSLIWGPVATSIVWGLAFSSALTLFVIPLLYCSFMRWSYRLRKSEQQDRLNKIKQAESAR